jgi:hypothetical protein
MTQHTRGPRLVARTLRILGAVAVLSLAATLPAQAAKVSVPPAPRSVHAVAGNANALVTWTKPASTGGSPIVGYVVTSSPSSGGCVTVGTKCKVTGLANAMVYTFNVRSKNKVGTGSTSLASNKVTPELPNSSDFAMTPINSASFNSIAALTASGPEVWAVSSTGGSGGSGILSEVSATTGKVAQIQSPSFSNPISISSDATHVWVANTRGGSGGTGSVSEIDVSTGKVTEIQDTSFDDPGAISSDATHVWVANTRGGSGGTGSVSEIDVSTGKVTEIDDASFDEPVGVSANGTVVIVANASGGVGGVGSLSEIVVGTRAVTQIDSPLLVGPTGVAASSVDAWVSDGGGGTYNDGAVLEVDLATGGVASMSAPSLLAPNSIALSTTSVWAANPNGAADANGSLTKIDTNQATPPYGRGLHLPHNPPSDIDPSPDYFRSGPCTVNAFTAVENCLNPCPSKGTFPAYSNLPSCSLYILQAINAARQSENVEPMVLPTDWGALSAPEQIFVLADLERTARGLAPYLGINAALSRAAQAGSVRDTDPKLAAGFAVAHVAGALAVGAVWADEFSTLGSDFSWMYSDGWGGSRPATFNYDCTSARASACWVHRDTLLGEYTGSDCRNCEMGVGFSSAKGSSSFAALVEKPAREAPAMTFTWGADVVPFLPKQ